MDALMLFQNKGCPLASHSPCYCKKSMIKHDATPHNFKWKHNKTRKKALIKYTVELSPSTGTIKT